MKIVRYFKSVHATPASTQADCSALLLRGDDGLKSGRDISHLFPVEITPLILATPKHILSFFNKTVSLLERRNKERKSTEEKTHD